MVSYCFADWVMGVLLCLRQMQNDGGTMSFILTNLPIATLITSGVAILLFIFNLLLENYKKKKANKLMLNGLCLIFIEQINFNIDVIHQIIKVTNDILEDKCKEWNIEDLTDNAYITLYYKNNQGNGFLITNPRTDFFENYFSQVAGLNENLFNEISNLTVLMGKLRVYILKILYILHKNDVSQANSINKILNEFNQIAIDCYVSKLNSTKDLCMKLMKK